MAPQSRRIYSLIDRIVFTVRDVLRACSVVLCVTGTRPALPDSPLGDEYKPVIQLFNSCTEEDFNKRPSAKEIVEQLETL
jgi:hypothetical protein